MSARILAVVDRVAALCGHSTHTSAWMSEVFGPTPAAQYPELRAYTDAQLVDADRGQLLAEIRRERAARTALRARKVAR